MSILLSTEQEQLTATLRKASEQHWPIELAIAAAEDRATADDTALWRAWVDIGAPGLGPYGADGSMVDMGLAIEEQGYALAPGAFLGHAAATCLVARLATSPGGASAARWVNELREARVRATTSLRPTEPPRLLFDDGTGKLHGCLTAVPDATTADVLVVPARLAHGADVMAIVRLSTPGVAIVDSAGVDPTRHWSRVELRGTEVPSDALLGSGSVTTEALAEAALDGAVLVAFDSVGSARRALDDAVAYAKVRHQFGRPIGSFQAVKHMLVDAHVAVDNARSSVLYAAWGRDTHPVDEKFAVHAAKALAEEVHNEVAATAVQIHGGIGFTRAIAAHLHVKRARANERLFGDPYHHRRAAAEQLGTVLANWSTPSRLHTAPSSERRDIR